jgi:hypothetical protein
MTKTITQYIYLSGSKWQITPVFYDDEKSFLADYPRISAYQVLTTATVPA